MQIKACPVHIKAVTEDTDAAEGTFEAIVSTYDIDSYGERVAPGAFADTLAEWEAKGDPIPVLWSHLSHDPDYHIGYVEKAEERDEGLWVKGRLDTDSPKAAQVYKLMKGRRVTQFSFAYDVLDAQEVKAPAGDGEASERSILELRKLKLYEVGPTLIGVNQATELLGVKAAENLHALATEAKAGRVLSSKNEETLRTAYEAIGTVLGTLSDDGKARASEPAAGASPAPMRDASAMSRSELLFLEAAI